MNEDKATRYHRLRRQATLAGVAMKVALLAGLLASGAAATLRDRAWQVSSSWFLAAATYAAWLALLLGLIDVGVDAYRELIVERRYGLSRRPARQWVSSRVGGGVVILLGEVAAGVVVLAAVRFLPGAWWVVVASLLSLWLVGLAWVAPVVLLPMAYDVVPLNRPSLTARLLRLADRAGADVVGVFEWRLGHLTKKANAMLAGLGRTRRILVSDTLLADHSDDEIEVILAHELAHLVHRDTWTSLALHIVTLTVACRAAALVLAPSARVLGLTGPNDLAVLPVMALTAGLVAALAQPLSHALSRWHEVRADRYALEATGNPDAFVSSVRRLGAQNLSDERPTRLVHWLFATHPSVPERIAAARAWASGRASL
jgi:STE24 endopeptidase